MKSHWDSGIRVKELIEQHQPFIVVELGSGDCQNTANLMKLREHEGFWLISVNDSWNKDQADSIKSAGVTVIRGISYLELAKMDEVDFCLIDTDHNGWTLDQEMNQLRRCLSRDGIVCIHDTVTFAKNQGEMIDGYDKECGVPYPRDEIRNFPEGMIEVIRRNVKEGWFEVERESDINHGAIALRRK